MKSRQSIISIIRKDNLLKQVLDNYYIDEQLMPIHSKMKYVYKIEDYQLGDESINNLTISTGSKRKQSNISFTINDQNVYTESDEYVLGENFKKEEHWVCNTKRAKHYCFLSESNLISVSIFNIGSYSVRIESEEINQNLKFVKNFRIAGSIYLNDDFSQEDKGKFYSRPATEDEIIKLNDDTNWNLNKKFWNIKQKLRAEIDGLEKLEFFEQKRDIYYLCTDKENLEELKSKGLKQGKNQIELNANIVHFDDVTVILKEINEIEIKH